MLLFEYYIYKIKHKEMEKANKVAKALADFLKKTVVKLTRETKVEHVSPLIDEKPEFAGVKEELRRKALDMAIKESLAVSSKRERGHESDSMSSYDERSHKRSKASGHHHRSSRRDEVSSSMRGPTGSGSKKESRRSRSRSQSRD